MCVGDKNASRGDKMMKGMVHTIDHIVVVNICIAEGSASHSITTNTDRCYGADLVEDFKKHTLGYITVCVGERKQ